MEIVTEQANTKPLRQSPAVSKPVRKPVETSLDKDEEDEEEEEADEDVQDVEDDSAPAGGKNSVTSLTIFNLERVVVVGAILWP